MEQFLRTELLLGKDKLKKLHQAKVTIIGLGAVGSYATEALARAGIGHLRLVDFDTIHRTNINRQLFALHSTIGRHKADVAAERVHDIYPACKVEPLKVFFHEDALEEVLGNGPDLVIDAIDAFTPKVLLLAHCHARDIPLISSMGAALRTNPFAIKTGDLFTSYSCPLAYRMRRALRKQGVKKGIFCVFSTETPRKAGADADELGEANAFVRGRKRQVLGSLPTITGIFGLIIANCAIEYLSGSERLLK